MQVKDSRRHRALFMARREEVTMGSVETGGRPAAGDNRQHRICCDDLRDWIAEADRLGELRRMDGASWQDEIGMAARNARYDERPGSARVSYNIRRR
jgi:hypothetical protein